MYWLTEQGARTVTGGTIWAELSVWWTTTLQICMSLQGLKHGCLIHVFDWAAQKTFMIYPPLVPKLWCWMKTNLWDIKCYKFIFKHFVIFSIRMELWLKMCWIAHSDNILHPQKIQQATQKWNLATSVAETGDWIFFPPTNTNFKPLTYPFL